MPAKESANKTVLSAAKTKESVVTAKEVKTEVSTKYGSKA